METQGTGLIIRVAGKVLPDAPTAPVDLVASEDSVIVRLIVLAGLPHVREGQMCIRDRVSIVGHRLVLRGINRERVVVEGRFDNLEFLGWEVS